MPRHPTLGWLACKLGSDERPGRVGDWPARWQTCGPSLSASECLRFLFGDAGLPHLQPVRINEAVLFLVGTLPGSAGSQFSQSVAIAFGSS